MRAYVGVTDGEWYRFLADRRDLDEVNFWRPGGGPNFGALVNGEPFFFKTHAPDNRVVGGGIFTRFERLRVSDAWEFFGEANGVPGLAKMRELIGKYRRAPIATEEDPEIGCVFIRNVRFYPRAHTADPPPGFASNIVQGKGYDITDVAVADYFEQISMDLFAGTGPLLDLDLPWHRPGPVRGEARPVIQRLGQGSFQAAVLNAYHQRCAITGAKIRPVLEAAHIRAVQHGGEHRLDNGLLLRSDAHKLFDRGYLGVDPQHRLIVSPRLRTEFGNGEAFYARVGESIGLPDRRGDRPNREFLEWHLDTVYKAA